MMVVVVIIGILVGLSSFGYRNWQQGLTQRQAQSDLRLASIAMENAKNFDNKYPTSLPSNFNGSDGVSITYIGGNTTRYCLEARGATYTTIVYYIDSNVGKDPVAGTCSSAFSLATPSPAVSSTTATTMSVSWAAVSGATSYNVKYGTASPPTTSASCTSSPCALTGLTANTQYRITVTASSAYNSKTSPIVTATTAASTLRCDSGDTLSGSTCTDTYTATYNPATSGRYTCPSGGTLSGSTCTTNQAYAATWVDGGGDFCIPPDTPYSPGVCQTPSGSLMSSESQGYTCPQGGTASGSTCYYRTYAATYQAGTAAYYSCPSGGSLSGTTCTRTYPAY